jgi:hypothetical protein
VHAGDHGVQANIAELLWVARFQPVAVNTARLLIPAESGATTVAEHERRELVERETIWVRRPVDMIGREINQLALEGDFAAGGEELECSSLNLLHGPLLSVRRNNPAW